MKQIKRLIIVGLGIFLVSCSSGSSTEEESYSLESNGMVSTITFEYKDDKVLKQTAVNEINYEDVGLTKEQLKESMTQLEDSYKDVDGVDFEIEYGDKQAVETLVIDYDKVDPEELQGLSGVTFGSDAESISGEETTSVSLKDSVELLEKAGYEKIEE